MNNLRLAYKQITSFSYHVHTRASFFLIMNACLSYLLGTLSHKGMNYFYDTTKNRRPYWWSINSENFPGVRSLSNNQKRVELQYGTTRLRFINELTVLANRSYKKPLRIISDLFKMAKISYHRSFGYEI